MGEPILAGMVSQHGCIAIAAMLFYSFCPVCPISAVKILALSGGLVLAAGGAALVANQQRRPFTA